MAILVYLVDKHPEIGLGPAAAEDSPQPLGRESLPEAQVRSHHPGVGAVEIASRDRPRDWSWTRNTGARRARPARIDGGTPFQIIQQSLQALIPQYGAGQGYKVRSEKVRFLMFGALGLVIAGCNAAQNQFTVNMHNMV